MSQLTTKQRRARRRRHRWCDALAEGWAQGFTGDPGLVVYQVIGWRMARQALLTPQRDWFRFRPPVDG